MTIQLIKTRFSALPPYFGGKRRLAPWIFGGLQQAVPQSEWPSLTFADAFVGGGSITMLAKIAGFKAVHANDWSARSQLVIRGLLENQDTQLLREDLLKLTQPIDSPGWVEAELCPSVFSTRHAKALDQLLYNVAAIECPTRQAIALLLVWHLVSDFVCFGTSIGVSNRPYAETLDGLRDWQHLNPKRFADGSLERLYQPCLKNLERYGKRLNDGVFCGSPVIGAQESAFDWLPKLTADILYLDPPYPGTLQYESSNRILDRLLTGNMPTPTGTSPFSTGVDSLWQLLDASRHVPIWLISYGNALIDLDGLHKGVQRIVPARRIIALDKPYKHLSHVATKSDNRELLVIAY